MPASFRPFVPPARERGAIAILAAMMMTALFVVALTEFSVAGLTIERRKTQNAVDAVALQLADEMLLKKNTDWQQYSSGSSYMLSHNGQDGSQFPSPVLQTPTWYKGFNDDPTSASSQLLRDRWIPATVKVTATVSPITFFDNALQLVSNLLPGASGPIQRQYAIEAKAQVQQVQISSFTVSRARAMLLFDFSPSMRLQYANTPPNDWYSSALWAEKAASLEILSWMHQQYNFSTRVFGYKNVTLDETLAYSTQQQDQPSWATATGQTSKQFQDLLNQESLGNAQNNGTDMISSIKDAVRELEGNNDYLAGAPLLILMSDGEPDQLPGTQCTQSLQSCRAQAVAATQAEMSSTWSISQDQIKGQSIETFTYLINRDNKNFTNNEGAAFMQSISGNKNHTNNPANFTVDEGAGGFEYMEKFMLNLPIKVYCMSGDISTFYGGKPADMAYPRLNEPINGYFTLGGDVDAANKDMYQAFQVFTWADLFADLDEYPKVDRPPPAGDPTSPYNTITHLKQILGAPEAKLARFFYDVSSHRVWLNPWLCFNLTYYQEDPTNSPPRFRMRWGHPTLINSEDDPLSYH